MADKCQWCKGTGVIAGFVWNTYPCECREAPAAAMPLGWRHEYDTLVSPNGLRVMFIAKEHAADCARWLSEKHPRIAQAADWQSGHAAYMDLTEAEKREWDAWEAKR